jgi:Transposase DDE domain
MGSRHKQAPPAANVGERRRRLLEQRPQPSARRRGHADARPPGRPQTQRPRPGWRGGIDDFMRRVLETDHAAALYKKRQALVEPVFAQTKWNRRAGRFQRRGRTAADPNGGSSPPPTTSRSSTNTSSPPPDHEGDPRTEPATPPTPSINADHQRSPTAPTGLCDSVPGRRRPPLRNENPCARIDAGEAWCVRARATAWRGDLWDR